MRVLAMASYPREAAATRFRVEQFIGPLRERGIELKLSPFLQSSDFGGFYKRGSAIGKTAAIVRGTRRRFVEIFVAGRYDLLFVQREAMFFGPAFFEWFTQTIGRLPIVLDLDDATYIPYESPSYGKLGSSFKFFGKTDWLIKRAAAVTCGNRFIAEYVESKGTRSVVIPTVADTEVFCPLEKTNDVPVIGWIGTHSTFPSIEWLFPVLQELSKKHRFILKIVGSGRENVDLAGVGVLNLPWSLEREAGDFRELDIGLYPIVTSPSANEQWLKGKSGFKAVQYMAVGVPFVMSPVGVCSEMGIAGKTHFNAESHEDWYNSLNALIKDGELRRRMGRRGRDYALANFTLAEQADKLEAVFRKTAD